MHCQHVPLLLGYGFQNTPDLRDHDKNEVEDGEMSKDDASIDSSINEGKAHFDFLLEVE